jgi:hypothetical protein
MAEKRDKSMIRLDYAALGDNVTMDSEIPIELIKKAKGFLGRAAAREEIVQLMDNTLRVQAAEVAARQVNPADLYTVGRHAVKEAIKHYKIGQRETFNEFATVFARQSMIHAKNKAVPLTAPMRPPPLRDELLGKKPPKQAPPPAKE